MKKVLLALLSASVLLLSACGGFDLTQLKVQEVQRSDDAITVKLSFDQSYDNVSLLLHADVDNDVFTGEADYSHELGAVEPGHLYTVEAPTGAGWAYSGEFKSVSFIGGQFSIDPPNVADELILITVMDGDTELTSAESTR